MNVSGYEFGYLRVGEKLYLVFLAETICTDNLVRRVIFRTVIYCSWCCSPTKDDYTSVGQSETIQMRELISLVVMNKTHCYIVYSFTYVAMASYHLQELNGVLSSVHMQVSSRHGLKKRTPEKPACAFTFAKLTTSPPAVETNVPLPRKAPAEQNVFVVRGSTRNLFVSRLYSADQPVRPLPPGMSAAGLSSAVKWWKYVNAKYSNIAC